MYIYKITVWNLYLAYYFVKVKINMKASKVIAIVLLIVGGLILAYGSFTYTKETHNAKIGSIELSIKDKETVNVPAWVGVLSMVVGAVLLIPRK